MFEAEVRHLRDSAMSAMSQGNIGRINEALDVYEVLFSDVLVRSRRDRATSGGSLETALRYGEYGEEWRVLLRDLYSIIEALGEFPRVRPWVDFGEFVTRVFLNAAERGEARALQDYSALVAEAWRMLLRSNSPDRRLLLDTLLMSLQTTIRSAQSRSFLSSPRDELIRRCFGAYVTLTKAAIDREDEEAGIACLDYLDNSFRFYGAKPPHQDGFVAGCLLTSYAWVLFRVDARGQADLPKLRARMRESMRHDSIWRGLQLTPTVVEAYTGSHWWELEMKGGAGGGVLRLHNYVTMAAFFVGFQVPPIKRASTTDLDQAENLLSTLDQNNEESYRRLADLPEHAQIGGGRLRESLAELVDSRESARKGELAKAVLDDAKIEIFCQAVVANVGKGRNTGLQAAFQIAEWDGQPTEVCSVGGRVPKEFFVDSDVDADPLFLAVDTAAELVRREELAILQRLFGSVRGGHTEGDLVALQARVESVRPDEGWTVATNSWHVVERLIPDFYSKQMQETESLLTSGGVRVYRTYNDDPPFAALFQADPTISISRRPPVGGETFETVDRELQLVVSVQELDWDESGTLDPSVRIQVREFLAVVACEDAHVEFFALTDQ